MAPIANAIARLRLDLRADEATAFPADPAVALHGALHRRLEAVDPELATAIHDAPVKPMTLSPLVRGGDGARPGPLGAGEPLGRSVAAGERATAWLGVLDGALLAALLAALPPGGAVNLDGRRWRVEAVAAVAPTGTPSPPVASYADLVAAATPAAGLLLRFCSPTAFRHKGADRLQPEPRLVVGSLLRRWRAFAPPGLLAVDDENDRLAAALRLVDARLAVRPVDLGGRVQPGFVGWARYRVDGDDACRRAVAALADYAAYAAVGARTALGMGQTERVR